MRRQGRFCLYTSWLVAQALQLAGSMQLVAVVWPRYTTMLLGSAFGVARSAPIRLAHTSAVNGPAPAVNTYEIAALRRTVLDSMSSMELLHG